MIKRSEKLKRKEKSALRGRMNSFISFLPNMVKMLAGLLKDSRVPTAEKALFIAAIVYVISPLDFIPDFFPFIGQVDDLYVVALTLLRLVNRSDASVVREHWSGGGDIVALADTIAGLAPRFLPKRISRVLSSKVEMGSASGILKGLKNTRERVVVEVQSDIDVDSSSSMPN